MVWFLTGPSLASVIKGLTEEVGVEVGAGIVTVGVVARAGVIPGVEGGLGV